MDPSAAARLPYPEVPVAPGSWHERTPRTQNPAPARQSHRLITFASGPGGGGGSLLNVAPSRSPSREGEFLPVDVLFRNAKDQ